MKNYIVKSLRQFDDYEGLEIKPENPRIKRNINDVFNVDKERYEYLKNLGLVELVGIDKKEEKSKNELGNPVGTREVKPKKTTKKKK